MLNIHVKVSKLQSMAFFIACSIQFLLLLSAEFFRSFICWLLAIECVFNILVVRCIYGMHTSWCSHRRMLTIFLNHDDKNGVLCAIAHAIDISILYIVYTFLLIFDSQFWFLLLCYFDCVNNAMKNENIQRNNSRFFLNSSSINKKFKS